jgi:arginase
VRRERWVETGGGGLRHLHAVTAACRAIYAVASTCARDDFPIFLGGDHALAIGTISGMAAHGPLGVIWIDAHGDYNTPETTPSGNIHGMPMAALSGLGHPDLVNLGAPGAKLRPQDIVMIAIRDLDVQERIALAHSGIIVYTMRDIDELGMATVARRALARLNRLHRIHVSLDMDALEPTVAPGVGTPVTGGLTFREAHLLMEILAESEKVCSLDVVEVNRNPGRGQSHGGSSGGADRVAAGAADIVIHRYTLHQQIQPAPAWAAVARASGGRLSWVSTLDSGDELSSDLRSA